MLGPLPPLKERTLAAVARGRLASAPDALAVRGPERSLSSAQLVEEALAVAGGFQGRGIAAAAAVLHPPYLEPKRKPPCLTCLALIP